MKMKEHILLGDWTKETLDALLEESSSLPDIRSRIDFLSQQFLGVPYKESTLIGGPETAEVFVINLKELDCFTFIDYIESLRVSKSFSEFRKHLVKVRYQNGEISYAMRNHFFTDWKEFNSGVIHDVTEVVGETKSKRITKTLNERGNISCFLPGVPCREREIVYIPSHAVDDDILSGLRTGDYIGIYSERKGLDVSHVGIFVRNNNVFLRHASRRHRKVVDEEFHQYISDKPGIIVMRPGLNRDNRSQ
jgi:hypothetical protein